MCNFDFITYWVIDQMQFPFSKIKKPLTISHSLLVIKCLVKNNILMKKVRINQEHRNRIDL